MIALSEARTYVLSRCAALEPRSHALAEALGCVLSAPIVATESVPPFANSAMDGYALRADDARAAPVRLRVRGTILAGEHAVVEVGRGDALRIMTGAPLPAGADAVCMIEHVHVEENGDWVVIDEPVGPGTNVRGRGEDVVAGETVFTAETVLTPAHMGVLASLGVHFVEAHPRPKVGVLSTGDELVGEQGALLPGKIRDANRPALLALVHQSGFEPVDLGIVGDDELALACALSHASTRCDAVLTSGGVSVGDRDVVKVVLDQLTDEMQWMNVAIKPAKPFAFGTLKESGMPVFGLPGNPVSSLVSFELFARPALRHMAGHRRLDRMILPAVAEVDWERRRDGKLHLDRAVATWDHEGSIRVRPARHQGSHQLCAMAGANVLALVPDGDGVAAGGSVDVLVLDPERLGSSDTTTHGWSGRTCGSLQ